MSMKYERRDKKDLEFANKVFDKRYRNKNADFVDDMIVGIIFLVIMLIWIWILLQ